MSLGSRLTRKFVYRKKQFLDVLVEDGCFANGMKAIQQSMKKSLLHQVFFSSLDA